MGSITGITFISMNLKLRLNQQKEVADSLDIAQIAGILIYS